jgi:allophanate hydrolase subunit 2
VDDPLELEAVPGPRDDWFVESAVDLLFDAIYEVGQDSDRVGLRLIGPPLEHRTDRELPSEGLTRGAVQVPRSGQPTLLLADHPTTGGYPVIAVVRVRDLDAAGQASPGLHLRFRPVRTRGRADRATAR